ncbi:MAG: choice-of-anchor Q domain-containing protein [bacterium]|nr:choice-of-anchor Q domain-containing protein [bacterium]
MGKSLLILAVGLGVVFSQPASSQTWYVDGTVTASGDGMTWETAFNAVQEGIDASSDGDTVIVAEGAYVENVHFHGKNITLTGTDPLDSTVVANTIIDGNQSGSVVTFSGTENETCTLSGFTIRNGNAPHGGGVSGGAWNSQTHARISNNVIAANSADWGGGLAFCGGLIQNNVIRNNSARHGGGVDYCSGAILNNRIVGNSAEADGGGLEYCYGTIENNTIYGNSAQEGGGLYDCDGEIRNCIIWGNVSQATPQVYASSEPVYCCIERWSSGGEGNMGFNPYFVAPENGDLHLRPRSPCIDAGDPASPFPNEPEPNGGRIDMGAYGNTWEATPKSPDTDNDNLPDDWEADFFGGLLQGANDDPDGDLLANMEEYRRAFDPTVPVGPWYVDASVPLFSGDGASWETAFKMIQQGIYVARDGGTIIVARGTYYENIRLKSYNVVLRSTDPCDSNVVANTIIDGMQAGSVVTFTGTEDETCRLSGFTIRNGKAQDGGGIYGGTWGNPTHATIERNVIRESAADSCGGGLYECDGTVRNNVIAYNSAGAGGGLYECDGTIENNTIWANSARRGGGLASCKAVTVNCIIWGDTTEPYSDQLDGAGTLSYCCIQCRGEPGASIIAYYPYLVDPANGDYHLLSWSPCIDAGDPSSPFSEEPQPNGGRINMGAYGNTPEASSKSPDSDNDGLPDDWETEFLGDLGDGWGDDTDGDSIPNEAEYHQGYDASTPPKCWYVDAAVSVSGDGTSRASALKRIEEGTKRASAGDTVIVAQGTYVEKVNFGGKNIILRSADPLDENIVARTIVQGRVTFLGTEDAPCALWGFTIQGGGGDYGGGICGGELWYRTHAAIRNNVVTGNAARLGGGGIAFCDGPIEGNKIIGNSATGGLFDECCVWDVPYGGGLYECDGPIRGNIVSGNTATKGGGLCVCSGLISDNLIAGNHAMSVWDMRGPYSGDEEWVPGVGAGAYSCGRMVNNTICENSSEGSVGGVASLHRMLNCIIWGNTAPDTPQLSDNASPSRSCIQDWAGGGIGNISADPLFVNAEAGDYRLQPDSPCIDAGVTYLGFLWPQRDLDRNCRLVGERVDMGCYEYGATRDADGDLLSDDHERTLGSDPALEDTDGDALRDGLEILRGSNPVERTPPGLLAVPSEFSTIQLALLVAIDGDEIVVAPGTYTENLRFYGSDVVLRSTDPSNLDTVGSTILEGDTRESVVQLTGKESPACVLSGFTIRNGWAAIHAREYEQDSQATIRGNIITGNSHGGLYYCGGLVERNIIKGNSDGGLTYCDGLIRGNVIFANSSTMGGGVRHCNGTLINNLIIGNSATLGGAIAWCGGTIENCTIVANSAQLRASGLYECTGTILNCIIWGNTAPEAPQTYESPNITYSCIQDWAGGGEGNIADDPLFVDVDGPDDGPLTYEDNDYRLNAASPCIDAGKNEEWMADAVDLDGNPRIWRGRDSWTADMGAYEYGSFHLKVATVAFEGAALVIGWRSAPGDTYRVWSCCDCATGAWTDEGTVNSWGWLTRWQDPRPTAMFRFYRVEIE